MPPTLPRTLAALTALTFVLATATACSDDASQAATTGVASVSGSSSTTASTSGASTPALSNGTTSTTPSTSQSSDPSKSSTPASPALATEDPKYVSAPAPGSTWTPPPLTAEQVQGNQNARDHGYEVNYQDPATFPLPAEIPAEPAMQSYGLEQTDLGAIESARYYLRSLEYAINTGDREFIDRVTLTTCTSCYSALEEISSIQGKSGFALTSGISAPKATALHESSTSATVLIDVTYPTVSIYNVEYGMVVKTPAHSGEWKFVMLWHESGQWVVDKLETP